MNLQGLGLQLREWTDDDVPVMVALFEESEVDRWTPLRHPFDLAAARAYLDQSRTRRAEGRSVQLAITTDGHAALGEILLFRTGEDAELAYAVGAAYRGQGLATRAVRLITDYAYRDLAVRHVVLRVDPANAASVAVARSTGFQLTDLPPDTSSAGGPLHTWRHQRIRERVPPLPPKDRDEQQAALVAQAGAELSVYTTLVRNTDVFADLLPLGQRLLQLSTLDPKARELVILRVAWRCHAPYVFTHHDAIGRAAGLTDDDLAEVVTDSGDSLLRATDELVTNHRLSDATWAALAGRYSTEQVIEICMLAGFYAMLAGALNTLGVQLEDGYVPPTWS